MLATLRLWGLPLAAVVVGLCFAPSLPALWHQWWDSGTFNHCLVVIPAAAWLVWEAESRSPMGAVGPAVAPLATTAPLVPLATTAPVAPPVATAPVAPPVATAPTAPLAAARWAAWLPRAVLFGLAALWLLARLLSVPVVEQGALVAAIPTLAWAVNGNAWARRHRFALLFCLLATPVGEFLVPPLMELTATITVALVRLCGIPVLRDGMLLTLASGDFVVAEACSGIRYLIASVTLGLLFAHLMYRTLRRKLWFLLAAVLTPLLANGLRAWMMVMIAHFTDLQYATGFDHLVYGWVFFGVVIVVLFFVGSLFQESGASSLPQTSSLPQASSVSKTSFPPQGEWPASIVGASLLATLLLVWAPLANLAADHALSAVKGELPAFPFPQQLGGYTYVGTAAFPTPLEYAGADRVDAAAYERRDERGSERAGERRGEPGGQRLYVAAIRYERDRPGHKFVSQSNRPYSFDWNRTSSGTATAGSLKLHYDDVNPKERWHELDTSRPWRVYSWYAVAGRTTTSAVKAKLLALLDWRTPRAAASPPTVFLVATHPTTDRSAVGAVASAVTEAQQR